MSTKILHNFTIKIFNLSRNLQDRILSSADRQTWEKIIIPLIYHQLYTIIEVSF